MAVSVGGINIQIGINTGRVIAGLKQVSTEVTKFESKLNRIKLEGAIKGDPFSAIKKHFKTADNTLDRVFQEWSKDVTGVSKKFDGLETASRNVTTKVMKQWDRLGSKLAKLKGFGGGKAISSFVDISGKAGLEPNAIAKSVRQVLEQYKGISKEVDKRIADIQKRFKKANKRRVIDIQRSFEGIVKVIAKEKVRVIQETKEFGAALQKAFKRQDTLKFAQQLKQAKSTTAALEKQKKTKRSLRIEEARLRTEIKAGINVQQNAAAILKLIADRRRQGIKLTQRQARELRKHRIELDKFGMTHLKVSKQGSGGIFSAAWFKQRALWFLQLRGFWEIYRGMTETVRQLTEFHKQLARAMRTANSATKTAIELNELYAEALGLVVRTFNVDFQQGAEVLYQLTSAGLSSEEALAGLLPTMKLIIATEGEARTVTKSLAGIYNNFADGMTNVSTKGEKLTRIAEIMVSTWRRHQVEISELTEGFKFASVGATSLGLSVEEVAGILGFLNDNMIKAGRAGRGLQNIFMRISRMPFLFARVFDVKIDVTKPLKFIEIMTILGEKFADGKLSVAEMSAAFERMGLRGAPLFIKLIQNWAEVETAIGRVKSATGDLDDVSEIAMDHIGAQLKRVANATVDWIRRLEWVKGLMNGIKTIAKDIADSVEPDIVIDKATEMAKNLKEFNIGSALFDAIETMDDNTIVLLDKAQKLLEDRVGIFEAKIRERGGLGGKQLYDYNKDKKDLEGINEVLRLKHIIEAANLEFEIQSSTKTKEIKEETKRVVTEAQRLWEWKHANLTEDEKITRLLKERKRLEGDIAAVRRGLSQPDLSNIDIEAIYKEMNRLGQKQANIQSEIDKILASTLKRIKEIWKIRRQNISQQIKAGNFEINALKKQRTLLSLQGLTTEELGKALKISEEIYNIKLKQDGLQFMISSRDDPERAKFAREKRKKSGNKKGRKDDYYPQLYTDSRKRF